MTPSEHRGSPPPRIRLRRAHEAPDPDDGRRILVDRLWPRGRSREAMQLDAWLKEVAPSTELRRWFGHDPVKWPEFQRQYRREIHANPAVLAPLLDAAQAGPLTLVYAARDQARNEAAVLRELLLEFLSTAAGGSARDVVGQASFDSFPASDAPGWATGRGRRPADRAGNAESSSEREGHFD